MINIEHAFTEYNIHNHHNHQSQPPPPALAVAVGSSTSTRHNNNDADDDVDPLSLSFPAAWFVEVGALLSLWVRCSVGEEELWVGRGRYKDAQEEEGGDGAQITRRQSRRSGRLAFTDPICSRESSSGGSQRGMPLYNSHDA